MPYSVGKSSYPDLKGVEQFVASLDVARQVASLCYEFDTQVAKNGDRLTVNEGIRSRDRQMYLRNQYLYHGGALAAYCSYDPRPQGTWTSTHDVSRGSALDFGITDRDGNNRALTQDEFDWLHARAPQRGIRWTGANFARVEPWHHNGGYAASVAPIPNVNKPGEKLLNAVEPDVTSTPTPTKRDHDDMQVNWNNTHTAALITAGSKHVTIDKNTPTRNGIGWKQQVTLCENHAAIDPSKSYPGGMNDAQLAVIRAVLNSMGN